ncbi:ATP-binding protein [Streptomyces sp. NPDC048527]|uniref:ATP-binding protein n=1 Tax=Streptomyces sp. NPDC048527 TaxID=3365568 RepID=UPI0037133EC9
MNPERITLDHETPTHHFAVLLSATRRGARLARYLSTQQLDSWGWPYGTDVSDAVAHLVAELAANAVQHGRVRGRDFRLRLTVIAERTLRIEVADARIDRLPAAADNCELPLPDGESGRGLLLVGALADAWGCDSSDSHTKTVWAEILLP